MSAVELQCDPPGNDVRHLVIVEHADHGQQRRPLILLQVFAHDETLQAEQLG